MCELWGSEGGRQTGYCWENAELYLLGTAVRGCTVSLHGTGNASAPQLSEGWHVWTPG